MLGDKVLAGRGAAAGAGEAGPAGSGAGTSGHANGHANAMQPDCQIVRGKVPGPVNHVLCGTHQHILDTTAKTIIAKDLAEYKKKFPAPAHAKPKPKPADAANGGGTGKDGPGAAAGAAGAAGAGTGAVPPAQDAGAKAVKIPIPPISGNDRADAVAQMSVLDTLRPVDKDPLHYTVTIGGQAVVVPKEQADKIRADAQKRMQQAIAKITDLCALALDDYATQKKVNDDQKIVSGAVRLFKYIGSLGKVHDPKDDIDKLVNGAKFQLATASGMVSGGAFGPPAGMIADAEGQAIQAGKIARVWSNELVDGASTGVTVLTHTRNISFGVMAGLAAIGTGGAAGAIAAAVIPTAADVAGKGLAGDKIDWSGAVIDISVNLLATKFGGQAEAAIKNAVAKQVATRLAGKLSGAALDKVAEKVGEKVAKQVVEKGSDVLKSVTKQVAKKVEGKDMTFGDMAEEVIKELGNPDSKESGKMQKLTEGLLKDAVGAAAV
ncbi:MAG: hypothetical protein WDN04_13050 [Rhodospirillales bacterium]